MKNSPPPKTLNSIYQYFPIPTFKKAKSQTDILNQKHQLTMASIRRLKMTRSPFGLCRSGWFSPNSTSLRFRTQMCLSKAGLSSKNVPTDGDEPRKAVAVKVSAASGCVVVSEPKTDKGLDLALLIATVSDAISRWWIMITKQRPLRFHVQMCMEKGCFLILQSYIQYFHAISEMHQQGQVVQPLIEAIDVFLVGTAMLIFGMALYTVFVGRTNSEGKGSQHPRPSLSGSFKVQTLPLWVGMQSVMEAKSKMGHALMMILLVEVLEKFKSVPVVSGWDLACFAAAIFVSSASIFLLARLAVSGADATR